MKLEERLVELRVPEGTRPCLKDKQFQRGCAGDMCSLFALATVGQEVSGLGLPRDPEQL